MDLLATRSLNFLGSPKLSPVDGSSVPSSPRRRIITSSEKPLLSAEEDRQLQEHHSSETSFHPQRTSSTKRLLQDQKSPTVRKSSFSQAVINGMYILHLFGDIITTIIGCVECSI